MSSSRMFPRRFSWHWFVSQWDSLWWALWREHWHYWKNRNSYGYQTTWDGASPHGEWRIYRGSHYSHKVVFRFPWHQSHGRAGQPPIEVRTEYERLIKYSPPRPQSVAEIIGNSRANVVEIVSDEEGGFDQPCVYGYRVAGHAVYCHNDAWLYSPRKCKRHTGDSVWGDEPWPHADCPGFLENPRYKGEEMA